MIFQPVMMLAFLKMRNVRPKIPRNSVGYFGTYFFIRDFAIDQVACGVAT